jgi:6-phosphogluconolactonase
MLQKALMLVLILAGISGSVSCGKTSNHYVYATVTAANQVAAFREDPYSGVLTQLAASPYTVGYGPQAVVIHPSGKFLYVANAGQNENDISLFNIATDGSLTEVTPRTPTGTLPAFLAMDPMGAYLYCANVLSNNVSVFSIGTSGALAQISGSPFPLGLPPLSMQLSPSGNFLFVGQAGQIAVFTVTQGAVSFVSETTTADNDPSGLAIDPSGTYLYTANALASSISTYTIGSSGALALVGQPLSDTSLRPVALAVDPSGKSLYVANQGSGNIGSYSITSGTGAPAAITGSPFSSEGSPSFLTMDPGGQYLLVGNQGASAGIQVFEVGGGFLTALTAYPVGNTPSSIAVLQ